MLGLIKNYKINEICKKIILQILMTTELSDIKEISFDKPIDTQLNYIYLIQVRCSTTQDNNVYKIGRTRQEKFKRFNAYDSDSILILFIKCINCERCENIIINEFKKKFLQCEFGNEYFFGNSEYDEYLMESIILDVVKGEKFFILDKINESVNIEKCEDNDIQHNDIKQKVDKNINYITTYEMYLKNSNVTKIVIIDKTKISENIGYIQFNDENNNSEWKIIGECCNFETLLNSYINNETFKLDYNKLYKDLCKSCYDKKFKNPIVEKNFEVNIDPIYKYIRYLILTKNIKDSIRAKDFYNGYISFIKNECFDESKNLNIVTFGIRLKNYIKKKRDKNGIVYDIDIINTISKLKELGLLDNNFDYENHFFDKNESDENKIIYDDDFNKKELTNFITNTYVKIEDISEWKKTLNKKRKSFEKGEKHIFDNHITSSQLFDEYNKYLSSKNYRPYTSLDSFIDEYQNLLYRDTNEHKYFLVNYVRQNT